MKKKPEEGGSASDLEIEREIRARRKFSVAEAIGRSAGGLMKGASPVTRRRQAEYEIEEAVERCLEDAEGALVTVLLRRVKNSEELLADYEHPLDDLVRVVAKLLASEEQLERFVNQVDTEWGRLYSERPHFDRKDRPPDPADPYTSHSVRSSLEQLLHCLSGETSSQDTSARS